MMPDLDRPVSDLIIAEVEKRLPNSKLLAKTLADLLNLSSSAIYRKISGEVPLTLEETFTLLRHFRISLDDLVFQDSNATGFRFRPLTLPTKDAYTYYMGTLMALQQAINVEGEKPVIHYATTEVTPFQYMYFPELTALQELIWSRMSTRWSEIEREDFRLEAFAYDRRILELSQVFIKIYNNTPSVDYISSSIINNNLTGLLYYAQQPVFSDPATPLLICEQLEKMLRHMFRMAKAGKKFHMDTTEIPENAAAMTMFHDTLTHYSTNIYFKSNKRPVVYTSFDHPNFMATANPLMIEYVEKWFENLRAHSHRISGEGELHREQLQYKLLKKIEAIKDQLRPTTVII
jgi:hypothetical protein